MILDTSYRPHLSHSIVNHSHDSCHSALGLACSDKIDSPGVDLKPRGCLPRLVGVSRNVNNEEPTKSALRTDASKSCASHGSIGNTDLLALLHSMVITGTNESIG